MLKKALKDNENKYTLQDDIKKFKEEYNGDYNKFLGRKKKSELLIIVVLFFIETDDLEESIKSILYKSLSTDN